MQNKRDYYEVLGVSKNATNEEIRNAYKAMAKKYHPDRQHGKSETEKKQAEEKFKDCSEAYEVLSDKNKRSNYDQFGFDGPQMSNANGFGAFNMSDFMHKHAGMFGGMFGDMFGHFGFEGMEDDEPQTPNYNMPEDGANIQTNIKITFKEAVNGCVKSFDLPITKECPSCHGTGIDNKVAPEKCSNCNGKGHVTRVMQSGFMVQQITSQCPVCNGSGYKVKQCNHCHGSKRIKDKKHISITIPQGIDNGQRLRVVGSGHCGVKGGKNGNLYINISIKHQNIFERNGLDLKTNIYVDPLTAMLGGKVQAPTPYNFINADIPAGTCSGKIIKLTGHGMKSNSKVGDLYLEVCIEPYSNLSDEQKKLLNNIKNKFTDKNMPLKNKQIQDVKTQILN